MGWLVLVALALVLVGAGWLYVARQLEQRRRRYRRVFRHPEAEVQYEVGQLMADLDMGADQARQELRRLPWWREGVGYVRPPWLD